MMAFVALFMFRGQVGALIGRTRRAGKRVLETFNSPPAQPTEETKPAEEFLRTFDNPLLVEAEALILKGRKLETPADRERAVVRSLASTDILAHVERGYGLIWASQLVSLRYLNPRDSGAELSDLIRTESSSGERHSRGA
jgi:hypothetical protein